MRHETSLIDKIMIRLSLSAAHNPNADSKIERGDGPIVKVLVKACKGHTRDRLQVLSYALWADRITTAQCKVHVDKAHTSQKPIMSIEEKILTCGKCSLGSKNARKIYWKYGFNNLNVEKKM